MPQISLNRLALSYGDNLIVQNIDLVINDGEFVSLLGPSGCGKTTTLRLIAGFLNPTGGSISVGNQVLSDAAGITPPEKRGMAMIFQSYAIWPHMTVAENVAFGLKLRKIGKAELDSRLMQMLKTVRLDHLADRYPSELSGGQQQRIALARALVVMPKILLLDEPLSNLDVHLREELRYEIRRLHDSFGMTTVYVTHDQSEAMTTSDRVVVMNQGRIEQADTPYDLYLKPKSRFVAEFIGKTNVIAGRKTNVGVEFPGFVIPSERLPSVTDTGDYSIRPEAISFAEKPGTGDRSAILIDMRVVARLYHGEKWEYNLAHATGDLRLKMTTPPAELKQAGDHVTIAIEPAALWRLNC